MICVSVCDCGELSVVELPCEARFFVYVVSVRSCDPVCESRRYRTCYCYCINHDAPRALRHHARVAPPAASFLRCCGGSTRSFASAGSKLAQLTPALR